MPVDVSVLTTLEATAAIDTFTYSGNPISGGSALWSNPVVTGQDSLTANGAQAEGNASSNACTAYRNDVTYGPDIAVMIDLFDKVSTDDGQVGIYLLQGTPGSPDGYLGEIRIRTTGDEWRIKRLDGGVETTLSSGTIQEVSAGDKFAFLYSSGSLELWWKTGGSWTFIVAATNSTYSAVKAPGLSVNDLGAATGTDMDNLRAMTIVAASSVIAAPSPPVTRVRLRAY